MSGILPSELARLVLGYLEKHGCKKAIDSALKELPYLHEVSELRRKGAKINLRVGDRTLEDVIEDYFSTRNMVTQQLELFPSCFKYVKATDSLRWQVRKIIALLKEKKTKNLSFGKLGKNSHRLQSSRSKDLTRSILSQVPVYSNVDGSSMEDNVSKPVMNKEKVPSTEVTLVDEFGFTNSADNCASLSTTNETVMNKNEDVASTVTVTVAPLQIPVEPHVSQHNSNCLLSTITVSLPDGTPQKRKGPIVKKRSSISPNNLSSQSTDDINIEKILKSLYENTTLHEKIAEKINKNLVTPETVKNSSLKNYTNSENISVIADSAFRKELDSIVSGVISDAASDPTFEVFLSGMAGDPNDFFNSDDSSVLHSELHMPQSSSTCEFNALSTGTDTTDSATATVEKSMAIKEQECNSVADVHVAVDQKNVTSQKLLNSEGCDKDSSVYATLHPLNNASAFHNDLPKVDKLRNDEQTKKGLTDEIRVLVDLQVIQNKRAKEKEVSSLKKDILSNETAEIRSSDHKSNSISIVAVNADTNSSYSGDAGNNNNSEILEKSKNSFEEENESNFDMTSLLTSNDLKNSSNSNSPQVLKSSHNASICDKEISLIQIPEKNSNKTISDTHSEQFNNFLSNKQEYNDAVVELQTKDGCPASSCNDAKHLSSVDSTAVPAQNVTTSDVSTSNLTEISSILVNTSNDERKTYASLTPVPPMSPLGFNQSCLNVSHMMDVLPVQSPVISNNIIMSDSYNYSYETTTVPSYSVSNNADDNISFSYTNMNLCQTSNICPVSTDSCNLVAPNIIIFNNSNNLAASSSNAVSIYPSSHNTTFGKYRPIKKKPVLKDDIPKTLTGKLVSEEGKPKMSSLANNKGLKNSGADTACSDGRVFESDGLITSADKAVKKNVNNLVNKENVCPRDASISNCDKLNIINESVDIVSLALSSALLSITPEKNINTTNSSEKLKNCDDFTSSSSSSGKKNLKSSYNKKVGVFGLSKSCEELLSVNKEHSPKISKTVIQSDVSEKSQVSDVGNKSVSSQLSYLLSLAQSADKTHSGSQRRKCRGSQSTPSYKMKHVRALDFNTPCKIKTPTRFGKVPVSLKFSPVVKLKRISEVSNSGNEISFTDQRYTPECRGNELNRSPLTKGSEETKSSLEKNDTKQSTCENKDLLTETSLQSNYKTVSNSLSINQKKKTMGNKDDMRVLLSDTSFKKRKRSCQQFYSPNKKNDCKKSPKSATAEKKKMERSKSIGVSLERELESFICSSYIKKSMSDNKSIKKQTKCVLEHGKKSKHKSPNKNDDSHTKRVSNIQQVSLSFNSDDLEVSSLFSQLESVGIEITPVKNHSDSEVLYELKKSSDKKDASKMKKTKSLSPIANLDYCNNYNNISHTPVLDSNVEVKRKRGRPRKTMSPFKGAKTIKPKPQQSTKKVKRNDLCMDHKALSKVKHVSDISLSSKNQNCNYKKSKVVKDTKEGKRTSYYATRSASKNLMEFNINSKSKKLKTKSPSTSENSGEFKHNSDSHFHIDEVAVQLITNQKESCDNFSYNIPTSSTKSFDELNNPDVIREILSSPLVECNLIRNKIQKLVTSGISKAEVNDCNTPKSVKRPSVITPTDRLQSWSTSCSSQSSYSELNVTDTDEDSPAKCVKHFSEINSFVKKRIFNFHQKYEGDCARTRDYLSEYPLPAHSPLQIELDSKIYGTIANITPKSRKKKLLKMKVTPMKLSSCSLKMPPEISTKNSSKNSLPFNDPIKPDSEVVFTVQNSESKKQINDTVIRNSRTLVSKNNVSCSFEDSICDDSSISSKIPKVMHVDIEQALELLDSGNFNSANICNKLIINEPSEELGIKTSVVTCNDLNKETFSNIGVPDDRNLLRYAPLLQTPGKKFPEICSDILNSSGAMVVIPSPSPCEVIHPNDTPNKGVCSPEKSHLLKMNEKVFINKCIYESKSPVNENQEVEVQYNLTYSEVFNLFELNLTPVNEDVLYSDLALPKNQQFDSSSPIVKGDSSELSQNSSSITLPARKRHQVYEDNERPNYNLNSNSKRIYCCETGGKNPAYRKGAASERSVCSTESSSPQLTISESPVYQQQESSGVSKIVSEKSGNSEAEYNLISKIETAIPNQKSCSEPLLNQIRKKRKNTTTRKSKGEFQNFEVDARNESSNHDSNSMWCNNDSLLSIPPTPGKHLEVSTTPTVYSEMFAENKVVCNKNKRRQIPINEVEPSMCTEVFKKVDINAFISSLHAKKETRDNSS